jgi:hypothetical protein
MMDDGILLAKYGVNNVHLFGDINVIQHDLSRERIVKTGGYEMQINRHGNILIIFFSLSSKLSICIVIWTVIAHQPMWRNGNACDS